MSAFADFLDPEIPDATLVAHSQVSTPVSRPHIERSYVQITQQTLGSSPNLSGDSQSPLTRIATDRLRHGGRPDSEVAE